MDRFANLPEPVFGRLFSCMLQRDAFALAALAVAWPHLVVVHLRRLLLTAATPLAVASFAAESFQRLREVAVDAREGSGGGAGFWEAAAVLLERLGGLPLERLVLRSLPLLEEAAAPLRLLQAALQVLRGKPSLQGLCIEHLALGHGSPAPALPSVLEALRAPGPKLAVLSLAGCGLGPAGVRATCSAITGGPLADQLQRLDLSLNGLGQPGALALAAALPRLCQLQALELRSNQLGLAGTRALAPGLLAVAGTLAELDVAENGMCAAGVVALGHAELQLQALSLRRNWVGPEEAQVLPQLLRSTASCLTSLDLAENKLGAAGIRALLLQLPSLPVLRVLDIALNHFASADSANAPFRHLAECAPNLEELNLFACGVGGDEAAARALLASLPPAVRVLKLGAADLRPPRLVQLLSALPELPQLEFLGLVQGRIDKDAAMILATGLPLERLPQLRCLDITGNPVGRDAALQLQADLRQRSPAFRQVKGVKPR